MQHPSSCLIISSLVSTKGVVLLKSLPYFRRSSLIAQLLSATRSKMNNNMKRSAAFIDLGFRAGLVCCFCSPGSSWSVSVAPPPAAAGRHLTKEERTWGGKSWSGLGAVTLSADRPAAGWHRVIWPDDQRQKIGSQRTNQLPEQSNPAVCTHLMHISRTRPLSKAPKKKIKNQTITTNKLSHLSNGFTFGTAQQCWRIWFEFA